MVIALMFMATRFLLGTLPKNADARTTLDNQGVQAVQSALTFVLPEEDWVDSIGNADDTNEVDVATVGATGFAR